jgi:DNA gyrase subunit B
VRFDVSFGHDSRSGQHEILVVRSHHGSISEARLDVEFAASKDYQNLVGLGVRLNKIFENESVEVRRGERSQAVSRFGQALDWLMDEARRGQTVQRYKGLGEMNPDQLWETTMDPNVRRLLRVDIEDGVAADQVFTTLMGDQVEPRRDFIEQNALMVANLDV